MSQVYFILTVVGWAWLVIVAVFLAVRLSMKRRRGFEVVQPPPPEDAAARSGGDAK